MIFIYKILVLNLHLALNHEGDVSAGTRESRRLFFSRSVISP